MRRLDPAAEDRAGGRRPVENDPADRRFGRQPRHLARNVRRRVVVRHRHRDIRRRHRAVARRVAGVVQAKKFPGTQASPGVSRAAIGVPGLPPLSVLMVTRVAVSPVKSRNGRSQTEESV